MKKVLILFLVICSFSLISTAQSTEDSSKKKDEPTYSLDVSGYFGTAVDSFAASDLKNYLNPEDSGDASVFSRTIFGIDFELDIGNHFYLMGETLHGVRSTDVDCENDPDNELCADFGAPTQEATLAILKSASSLEAFAEIGVTFPLIVNKLDFFVAGRAGFVTVADSGGDVLDNHFVGGGILITDEESKYDGSYLEIGWGRSQFFKVNPNRRLKIEGMLSFPLNKENTVSMFAQMAIDSDFGDGADSIQSYYGVSWDMVKLMEKISGSGEKKKNGGEETETQEQ